MILNPSWDVLLSLKTTKSKTYIAKNKEGWYALIDIVSKKNTYSDDVIKKLLKVSLNENLICIDDLKQKPAYYVATKDAELHRILLMLGHEDQHEKS